MNSCCKDCENRTAKCHISCDKYKNFRIKNEEIKKNRRKETINRSAMFRANYIK